MYQLHVYTREATEKYPDGLAYSVHLSLRQNPAWRRRSIVITACFLLRRRSMNTIAFVRVSCPNHVLPSRMTAG